MLFHVKFICLGNFVVDGSKASNCRAWKTHDSQTYPQPWVDVLYTSWNMCTLGVFSPSQNWKPAKAFQCLLQLISCQHHKNNNNPVQHWLVCWNAPTYLTATDTTPQYAPWEDHYPNDFLKWLTSRRGSNYSQGHVWCPSEGSVWTRKWWLEQDPTTFQVKWFTKVNSYFATSFFVW